MTTWFHTMILATCAVATLAVGMAGAGVIKDLHAPLGKKEDRLASVAAVSDRSEVTVEQRQDGLSILTRMPAPIAN